MQSSRHGRWSRRRGKAGNVGHHLVGFRKTDELVGEQHELPEDLLEFAKGLAKVRKNDPDAVFPYPLRPAVARELAAAMGVAIDPEHHNYFLEGYAKTSPLRKHASETRASASAAT